MIKKSKTLTKLNVKGNGLPKIITNKDTTNKLIENEIRRNRLNNGTTGMLFNKSAYHRKG